ncbi:MAG: glycosyltransferase [Alsobacter sp.]
MRLGDYSTWREQHHRPMDVRGLEAPRFGGRLPGVRRLVTGEPVANAPTRHPAQHGCLRQTLRGALDDLDARDLVAAMPGCIDMRAEAAAVLAETAARYPTAEIFYCDEEIEPEDGLPMLPHFRPDWRKLDADRLRFGRDPVFVRAGRLRTWAAQTPGRGDRQSIALHDLGPGIREAAVVHIRRPLVLRRGGAPRTAAPALAGLVHRSNWAAPRRVSIVIPTRDRVDFLRPCLDGLLHQTHADGLEVVLVDNGSRERRTRRFYATLASESRVVVLDRPGPFNFSLLANVGAAAARSDILVFLNNDVAVIEPLWLDRLLAFATREDVGAVGARLIYPSGGVQHDGVVLGIGGFAGHVQSRRPRSAWGDEDDRPRVVSAVTGACLAVERAKFDAVGGFDAVDLPVDLSDVDLCLKLASRGWDSVLVPDCRLIHHESATRGDAWRPFTRYARERKAFRRRWGHKLANDPFFPPALSLFSREARLA